MKKETISAYLVVFNEERKIEKALKSLVGIVDEIVVVHDGICSDNTINITKKYTNKIFIMPFIGNAEPHRPFAIKQCSGNWIIQIDADERLSKNLQKNLRKIIQEKDVDAYIFNWVVSIRDKKVKMIKKILFRKNKAYYIGLPHFQVETYGVEKYINLDLIHDTSEFDSTWELLKSYIKKDKKCAKVALRYLIGKKKIPFFNCNFDDKHIKQKRKILLLKKHPLLSLFILPTYSFLRNIIKNYHKGFLGIILSLQVPVYLFFLALNLSKNDKK